VGVDLSPEALELAESAFARYGVNGEFVRGDVRGLPFPDDSFDFVYAGGVVEHFRETSQAVGEMARVARRLARTDLFARMSYGVGTSPSADAPSRVTG
jgi:ubiquinone/menaquinone biosynthesis C-methylase UbiE